jgi:MoaA/NifB/PqqE/SkfB family radical SAM enzyme
MIWSNKGHEFDRIGSKFLLLKRIYIYGAGSFGSDAAKLLSGIGANIFFVDQEKSQQKKYMNIDVISPEQMELKNKESIVILAMGRENAGIVLKQLELKGYKYGEDIYDFHSFMTFYIYIIALYKYKKCIMIDCSVMATYKCSLKCKHCMGAFPYMKNPLQVDIEAFKRDVDILFSNIDYVLEFGIAGGEILLCRDLEKYIEYVMDHYADQIGNCTFLTNGTILPNENIIEVLKKYNMRVDVSNYCTVKNWNRQYEKLKELISKNGIPIKTINYTNWVEMGWHQKKYKEHTDHLFDSCGMQCRVVRNGMLNYCVHGMTANDALYQMDISEDEFDLSSNDERKKYQLVEYHLGFNKNGSLKTCHYCNGYININKSIVDVAEQNKWGCAYEY